MPRPGLSDSMCCAVTMTFFVFALIKRMSANGQVKNIVSPNFSACVHDRILRGLNAGCRIITEENLLLRQTFGDVLTYFDYNDFDEKTITESYAGNIGATNKILSQFAWTRILTAVIEDYQRRVGTREN